MIKSIKRYFELRELRSLRSMDFKVTNDHFLFGDLMYLGSLTEGDQKKEIIQQIYTDYYFPDYPESILSKAIIEKVRKEYNTDNGLSIDSFNESTQWIIEKLSSYEITELLQYLASSSIYIKRFKSFLLPIQDVFYKR
jgi:hypothetical protein